MTQQIILTNGAIALVDDEDFDRLNQYRWTFMTGRGYAIRSENRYYCKITKKATKKSILMHRDVAGFPDGKSVDHINGNFLDNRRVNLRVCDQINNTQNRRKQKNPGKSEGCSLYKGVRRNMVSKNKRWIAYISINKKITYIGTYDTEIEAARSYNEAASKHFGEYAILNPIPE